MTENKNTTNQKGNNMINMQDEVAKITDETQKEYCQALLDYETKNNVQLEDIDDTKYLLITTVIGNKLGLEYEDFSEWAQQYRSCKVLLKKGLATARERNESNFDEMITELEANNQHVLANGMRECKDQVLDLMDKLGLDCGSLENEFDQEGLKQLLEECKDK